MKSSMALVLLIINLCGTITLIGLIPLPQTQSSSRNKNETIPNSTELNETQIKTQSNLDEDEFVLSYKQISPQNSSKNDSKNYKKSGEKSYMFIVLLLDTLTIFTTFVIIFSFCVDQNECCNENPQQNICCCTCAGTCCAHYCLRAKCRSRSSSKKGGAANLAILIFLFLLLYCAVSACGKHVSRYVGVTINMLFFLAMFVLSNIFYFDNTSMYDRSRINVFNFCYFWVNITN